MPSYYDTYCIASVRLYQEFYFGKCETRDDAALHYSHGQVARDFFKSDIHGPSLFVDPAVYRGYICVPFASVFVCGMGGLTGKGLTPAWAPT